MSPRIFAFYKYATPSISHFVVSSILALRFRALFPINLRNSQLHCACKPAQGHRLNWTLHHIAFECKHGSHTVTPHMLETTLSDRGEGWWTPRCHKVQCGLSTCSPALHQPRTYSCLHQCRALAPNLPDAVVNPHFDALRIWATYMHDRLKVCYPGNFQSDWYPISDA